MVTSGRGILRCCGWRGHVGACGRSWIYSSTDCVVPLGGYV